VRKEIVHTASGRGGWFAVEITRHEGFVRVAVADCGGPAEPHVIDDPALVHGRGLLLVRGLSMRTGVTGDQRGRLVWAEIAWDATGTAARAAFTSGGSARQRPSPADATAPAALRARMAGQIVRAGHARSGHIEGAFRAVPRHEFVPGVTLEEAYADQAVITRQGGSGAALSCAPVPSVAAAMLSQLDARPGDRILEIGAGTGYNAALLAHLTGPSGQVTTIDVDEDVTAQARRALDAAGYCQVGVITADGAHGDQEHAPYDRIIVTAGAWDLPPAWREQLAPGGRLVVPLRWRGQARSIAFTPGHGALRSDSVELGGSVPMIGQYGERIGCLDPGGQVCVHWDAGQPIHLAALDGVLGQPKTAVWSGVTVRASDPFDGIWLRLTSTEPGTCRIAAQPAAAGSGLCTPAIPARSPALAQDDSLAYLTRRLRDDVTGRRWELGATGHGPAGPLLADRICGQISAWDRGRAIQPVVTAYPAGTPDDKLPGGHSIDKPHVRLVVSW
jgi:protein-L-isoaspartate(D-aspartate) O-methyltransferase